MGQLSHGMKAFYFLSIFNLLLLVGYIYFQQTKQEAKEANAEKLGEAENKSVRSYASITYDLPTQISFAGEQAPLHLQDVRERLDKELQINIYLQGSTLFLLKRANRWLPRMQEILKMHGIPDDFKYLPMVESALLNGVSGKNAVGYWQILEGSGKELRLEITKEVDQRYDPIKSTEAACRYLKKAYEKFGNWTLVAASYNRGMFGLERDLKEQMVSNFYDLYQNDETSRYVFRILAIKEIVEHPERYSFQLKPEHLYPPDNHRMVEVTETINDLIGFAKAQGINYKLLRRHNPWLRQTKLTVKKGKSYKIAIPF